MQAISACWSDVCITPNTCLMLLCYAHIVPACTACSHAQHVVCMLPWGQLSTVGVGNIGWHSCCQCQARQCLLCVSAAGVYSHRCCAF